MERQGFTVPLLIGGATTSRQHTAVKIAPAYSGAVVHVLDASRAVGVVSGLLSTEQQAVVVAELRADQQRLREAHALRTARPLLPYSVAQQHKPAVPFDDTSVAPLPQLGRRVEDIPLATLVPYIDWTFLFVAWDLKGKYPQILEHPEHGQAARELFGSAQVLLERMLRDDRIKARAVWGLWPAGSDGNDVVVYADANRHAELTRFCFLRQQQKKTDDTKPYLCLADWVAPHDGPVPDAIGAFAVTAGIGADELAAEFRADHDDFHAILVQAIADRLAEAAAEWLHEKVRRLWYAPDEQLSNDLLIAEDFRGIRPAFGYPTCPDHTEKSKLWQLLQADDVGIHLTETLSMVPAASVSGLYMAHPGARYFNLGPVGGEQLVDYARRKGTSIQEVERALQGTIAEL
jgi:5-methyltetrahydrofolate--homocysteine methyltransferase